MISQNFTKSSAFFKIWTARVKKGPKYGDLCYLQVDWYHKQMVKLMEEYSTHLFRCSVATIFSDTGVNITNLNIIGRWNSNFSPVRYIDIRYIIKIENINFLERVKKFATSWLKFDPNSTHPEWDFQISSKHSPIWDYRDDWQRLILQL